MTKRKTTVILWLLVVAMIFGVASLPSIQSRYHLWQLEETHQQLELCKNHFKQVGSTVTRSEVETRIARYQHHLDRLVDLGVLFRGDYLENDEDSDLAFYAACGFYRWAGLDESPTFAIFDITTNKVEIYDLAERKTYWDLYIRESDEPTTETKVGLIQIEILRSAGLHHLIPQPLKTTNRR